MKEMIERFENERPNKYEDFPDIELYKDQILSYMKRQNIPMNEAENLTGAMINNYTKVGLLPRSNGKKYDKNHIALLTATSLLKQVISVNETDMILKKQKASENTEVFYDKLYSIIDEKMSDMAAELKNYSETDELIDIILSMAIKTYVSKCACELMIEELKNQK